MVIKKIVPEICAVFWNEFNTDFDSCAIFNFGGMVDFVLELGYLDFELGT